MKMFRPLHNHLLQPVQTFTYHLHHLFDKYTPSGVFWRITCIGMPRVSRLPAVVRPSRGRRRTKEGHLHHHILFWNHGTKMLVRCLYASKSGRPAYCFSSNGTPDTKRMSTVMVIGPTIVAKPHGMDTASSQIPHHCVTSPK